MASRLKPPVDNNDHIQGPHAAPLELVEYGDYQCPHCRRAYPMVKQVQRTLGNDLKFVFRNFPISTIHPDALHAAIAAESAALQGKFWEMHDLLYENQEFLDREHLVGYARSLGLNIVRFRADLRREDITEKIESDFESGVRSGVNGTPTFFVNGHIYQGAADERSMLNYLQSLTIASTTS